MAVEKLVLFRLNDQVYGIDIDFVSAIEFATEIVHIPNAPANLEGIISLRGEILPVYSLHKKFHLTEDPKKKESQLIITKSKHHAFAFLVDAVDEIHIMGEGDFFSPPQLLKSEQTAYIKGIAKVSDKLVLCVDVEKVVSETELQNIEGIVTQMTNAIV